MGEMYMHKDYDQLLSVRTVNSGIYVDQLPDYHPYEATPYSTLHILFKSYQLKETDELVDFGCGKGRLLFYVHSHFEIAVTGIEMENQLYQKTLRNKQKYYQKAKHKEGSIQVKWCFAEDYQIKNTENKFYFFNPFSVEIFATVVQNILDSIEKNQREVDIILYYPSIEYIEHIEKNTPFILMKEVNVPGLHKINNRERFLIYRLTDNSLSS